MVVASHRAAKLPCPRTGVSLDYLETLIFGEAFTRDCVGTIEPTGE